MIDTKPYVLIITPEYNRASLLPEAIESVLAQDYPHKKMVIIDDGSTDNSRQVCRKYIDEHPQIIFYYHKENGGCASARNFGLDLIDDTIGYVCFLDSDDRMLPGKLSREIGALQQNSRAGFCYSNTVYYIEDKRLEISEKAAAYNKPDRFAIEHFLTNNASPGAILYKSATLSGKRFDESMRYNEDSEFLQRVAIENKCIYISTPGSWIRVHRGSKSQNRIDIYRGVLYASVKTLKDYPAFYQSAASLFDNRVKDIKRQLFIELILDGQWEEARQYAAGVKERYLAEFKLSGYYRLTRFLKQKASGVLLRYKIITGSWRQ
jgi:glycosyltransferase involved in cell wall biosynthesis